MGKVIEYDGDGPTNPDRTSRYGKKCQSSTTWLLAALDDDGLDLYSNDDYWHSVAMNDDADEIRFRSFHWNCSVSFVVAELLFAAVGCLYLTSVQANNTLAAV